MADIAGRPGVWVRAGQTGVVTGLNWTAYLALLPDGVSRDRMVALARPYEAGLILGSAELVKKS